MNDEQPVFYIRAEQDLKDFQKDLKDAAKRTKRNGGAYPVFVVGPDWKLVRIEIQFPIGA